MRFARVRFLAGGFVNFVATLDGRDRFSANAIVMGAITTAAEFHSIILGAADRSFV